METSKLNDHNSEDIQFGRNIYIYVYVYVYMCKTHLEASVQISEAQVPPGRSANSHGSTAQASGFRGNITAGAGHSGPAIWAVLKGSQSQFRYCLRVQKQLWY